MIDKKTVVAIILARGGSKRLANKNIRLFAGKPLIAWTIEAARKSKYIDRIIVSTDSEKIAAIAKQFGADAPFLRPSELASDTATSELTILHVLTWVKENEENYYDYFILLQPTSPLRKTEHINEAIKLFEKESSVDALISVTKVDKNPYWIQIINQEGFLRPFLSKKDSQSETLYLPNGALYITKIKEFMMSKSLYTEKTIGFLMNKEVSIDIDEEFDLKIAEYIMAELKQK